MKKEYSKETIQKLSKFSEEMVTFFLGILEDKIIHKDLSKIIDKQVQTQIGGIKPFFSEFLYNFDENGQSEIELKGTVIEARVAAADEDGLITKFKFTFDKKKTKGVGGKPLVSVSIKYGTKVDDGSILNEAIDFVVSSSSNHFFRKGADFLDYALKVAKVNKQESLRVLYIPAMPDIIVQD